jgi:hypothetical protein
MGCCECNPGGTIPKSGGAGPRDGSSSLPVSLMVIGRVCVLLVTRVYVCLYPCRNLWWCDLASLPEGLFGTTEIFKIPEIMRLSGVPKL